MVWQKKHPLITRFYSSYPAWLSFCTITKFYSTVRGYGWRLRIVHIYRVERCKNLSQLCTLFSSNVCGCFHFWDLPMHRRHVRIEFNCWLMLLMIKTPQQSTLSLTHESPQNLEPWCWSSAHDKTESFSSPSTRTWHSSAKEQIFANWFSDGRIANLISYFPFSVKGFQLK